MTGREKKITIKDVAREAGMSVTTISCILNGHPGYSEETRKKVWNLASQMHYTPDPHARNMRGGSPLTRKGNNHLIMHVSHLATGEYLRNPDLYVHDSLISNLEQFITFEARNRNYFTTSYYYYQAEGFRCPPLLNGVVDGALLGLPHKSVAEIVKGKIPAVMMDINRPSAAGLPVVNTDFLSGFEAAFRHLYELGYRKCAFIYSPELVSDEMIASYNVPLIFTLAARQGIEISEPYSFHDPISYETHAEVAEKMALRLVRPIQEKKLDLIITLHIGFARTIRAVLEREGIRIPQDVGLFTQNGEFDPASHSIASVGVNWRKMVPCALDVLISLIEKAEDLSSSYSVPAISYYEKTIRNIHV